MTSTVGLGVPIPKLLPVTSTFALPFALYHVYLSLSVVNVRNSNEQFLGAKLDKSESNKKNEPDPLDIALRAHGNFLENVPLTLLLSTFAELNGADRNILTAVLSVFFAVRIAHVEFGLKSEQGVGTGRAIGYYTTLPIIVGLAGYTSYLVKGYWGF